MDFESDETLKTFFTRIEKVMDELKDHGISSSYTSQMAKYLVQIQCEGGEFFNRALDEWNTKASNRKTWSAFKAHFSEADKKRRQALKAAGGKHAKAADRESANHAKVIDDVNEAIAEAMTTFAEVADESINAAITQRFKALEGGNNNNKVDKDENDINGLMKVIRSLEQQVKDLKSKGGNGGGGGGRGKDKDKDKPPAKLCTFCKTKHRYNLNEACWKRKENYDNAPDWWKARNEKPDE